MCIDKGNVDAMLKFGDLIVREKYLAKISRDEFNYLKKAVDLGHPKSTFKYGYTLYQGGFGFFHNKSEGAKYIKIAADKGVIDACRIYAGIVHTGDGIPPNQDEAIKYYEIAIENGDIMMSAFEYAEILYKGEGIEEDKKLAAKYYKMAADEGNSTAMMKYGEMLKYGDGIDMNKEEGERYIKLSVDNEKELDRNYQFIGYLHEIMFPGSRQKMIERYPAVFD